MAKYTNIYTKDMQTLQEHLNSKEKICIDGNINQICGAGHACDFYLSGNYIQKSFEQSGCDYVLSENEKFNSKLLTPDNNRVFLFEADY